MIVLAFRNELGSPVRKRLAWWCLFGRADKAPPINDPSNLCKFTCGLLECVARGYVGSPRSFTARREKLANRGHLARPTDGSSAPDLRSDREVHAGEAREAAMLRAE